VVATATKALQEQLLTKDVPAAAAALGRRVRVAVLKGRQNYLCRKSLQGVDQLGGLFRTAEDAPTTSGCATGSRPTETGDRAELDFEPSESLWAELSVGADRCAGARCPLFGSCFAEKARERAGEAELVIANHALYFADLALRTRSDGAASSPSTTRSSSTRRTASRTRPPRGSAGASPSRGSGSSSGTWSASAARRAGRRRPGRSPKSTEPASGW
jgi:ATP-dependent DNA helicase DinG